MKASIKIVQTQVRLTLPPLLDRGLSALPQLQCGMLERGLFNMLRWGNASVRYIGGPLYPQVFSQLHLEKVWGKYFLHLY